ncbi:hypothetical protein DV738_g2415, partial [Chaetothyriales sp. CBS 135597]
MSATTETVPGERSSTPLASNNPFRNKINGSSSSATAGISPRLVSTNPFLDPRELTAEPAAMVTAAVRPSSSKGAADTATDLLSDLKLNGKPNPPENRPAASSKPANGQRGENLPPPYRGQSPGYRRAPSNEEPRRRDPKLAAQKAGLDIFADPPTEKRRPRRNSESSVRDKPRSLDPEEEKKRRERKQRDQKHGRLARKASKKLDVIDRLDVTSIYGAGLFHHDGPFDACNPHRNRKGARAAPMQAFPEGSLNMQLGGSGPVQKSIDIDQYHGRGQEAHGDYNEAAVVDEDAEYLRRPQHDRGTNFNPLQRSEPVHGNETAGLGTSTFLEGTPASRAAIERRESEYEQQIQQMQQQGLTRKKSLVQRIRRNRSNTASAEPRSVSSEHTSPAPIPDAERRDSNSNPFFKEYDREYEKKGTQIAFAEEEQKKFRGRTPVSPRKEAPAPLYRTKTADSVQFNSPSDDIKVIGSGFLSRVKSLKGGRRTRSERRDVGG